MKIWLIFEKKYSVGDIGTGRIENANWLKGHGIVLWNQFLIWFRLSACHHFCDKAVLRSPPLLVWKLRRGQKFWIFIQDYTADRWPVCVCVFSPGELYDEDILESKISHRAKPKWRETTLWYEKIPRKTLHFKITVVFCQNYLQKWHIKIINQIWHNSNGIFHRSYFTGQKYPTKRLDKMAGCDWLTTPHPVGSNGEI